MKELSLSSRGWDVLLAAQLLSCSKYSLVARLLLDVEWKAKLGELLVCN